VLLLIALGIGLNYTLGFFFEFNLVDTLQKILPVLGIVGLIMIVLEAALDLKLEKKRSRLIWSSFLVALLSLIGSALLVALVIQYFFIADFYVALIYATPLAIMSSAIVLPSVAGLSDHKREFMIYEATFSDILGIMMFTFLIKERLDASAMDVTYEIIGSVIITLVVSVAIGIALVWVIQRITSKVKLFLLIAVLMLLYSIGKKLHLSSLLIILFFGLMLSNSKLIFRGKLSKLVKPDLMSGILHEMHLITGETAFVVRTFFFIVFGMTIHLGVLLDWKVAVISVLVILLLYGVRFVFLRVLEGKGLKPIGLIAPRGLITVLLYYQIFDEPNKRVEYFEEGFFEVGVLFYVILISSLIMMFSLISGEDKLPDASP